MANCEKRDYFYHNELKENFTFFSTIEEEKAFLALLATNALKIKYRVRNDPEQGNICETVSAEPDNISIQDVF